MLALLVAVGLVACSGSPAPTAALSQSVPVGELSGLGPLASPSPRRLGPEGAPIPPGAPLADLSKAASEQVVDGIRCETSEQVAYHVHARLAV